MAIPPDLLKQVRVSLMIFDANALLSLPCPLNVRKRHDLGERGLDFHDKCQFGLLATQDYGHSSRSTQASSSFFDDI
jgi:hypothetical protein